MAADLNNAKAQYLYGSALERGFGVNQDFPEARRYYEKSALRHNGDAAFALAKMYLEGHGVSSDEAEGVRWLQVGAKFLGLAAYDKTLAKKDLAKACESKDAQIADKAKSLLRTIGSECPTLPAR
jgi:TPR repeat protein